MKRNKFLSIDEAVNAIESVILKNRHSLTEDEVKCLIEGINLLKEYKDQSKPNHFLNPQIVQKTIEVLLKFLLEDDVLNKLEDLFS